MHPFVKAGTSVQDGSEQNIRRLTGKALSISGTVTAHIYTVLMFPQGRIPWTVKNSNIICRQNFQIDHLISLCIVNDLFSMCIYQYELLSSLENHSVAA